MRQVSDILINAMSQIYAVHSNNPASRDQGQTHGCSAALFPLGPNLLDQMATLTPQLATTATAVTALATSDSEMAQTDSSIRRAGHRNNSASAGQSASSIPLSSQWIPPDGAPIHLDFIDIDPSLLNTATPDSWDALDFGVGWDVQNDVFPASQVILGRPTSTAEAEMGA